MIDFAYLDDKVFYQSPYMVGTDNGYIKHYYMEGQRITFKIGSGFSNADINPVEDCLPIGYTGASCPPNSADKK